MALEFSHLSVLHVRVVVVVVVVVVVLCIREHIPSLQKMDHELGQARIHVFMNASSN